MMTAMVPIEPQRPSPSTTDNLKRRVRAVMKTLPFVGRAYVQREELRAVLQKLWEEPGHFYSPIPSEDEVRQREAAIFDTGARSVAGIDLNEAFQLQLVETLSQYYREQPFARTKQPNFRFFFENPAFSYFDAIVLFCMIRHVKPKRIIEIGSGYSSCVMLDTNERFFGHSIACTFIEPNPELVISLLKDADRPRVTLIPKKLQDVDPRVFASLEPNDILFIDSSHVSKTGSDVNHEFFEILPRLIPGVYVHVHDVFYPFEYPKAWVYQGRAWNEAYLVRAFLQYNDSFSIQLFNHFLECFHRDLIQQHMPLCLEFSGHSMIPTSAQSIWLKKLRG